MSEVAFGARSNPAELDADPSRVIAKLYLPGESVAPRRSRVSVLSERIRALAPDAAARLAADIISDYGTRHHDLPAIIGEHAIAASRTIGETPPDGAHGVVLGASFTAEYAVEGAALCNPSATLHPDQSSLEGGQARVALAVRQIGEGHVSSLGFAEAIIGPGEQWAFQQRAKPLRKAHIVSPGTDESYHAAFDRDGQLSARVILPAVSEERNGIEDARLLVFTHDDGRAEYRATYTAYDGRAVIPRLLVSPDLVTFESHRLTGSAATNKGIALFPRAIGGELMALTRSDGETNSLARSPDGIRWNDERAIRSPSMAWEIVQSGNCGPPIETDAGWLVLTHGVGPMRTYSMGAMLLDLDDPLEVIGILPEPLLRSVGARRDGYVPNVVYSCGSILHDGVLWIPFGVGDNRIGVASIGLTELLGAMR